MLFYTTDITQHFGKALERNNLALWIEKLIFASIAHDKINELRFPAGNAGQTPSWDGYLVCEESNNMFVPTGISGWELGTGASDIKQKLMGDCEKRSDNPAGIKPNNATLILVTTREYGKKLALEQELKKNYPQWQDIKIYDVVTLYDWFKECPAVELDFAKEIEKISGNIKTITQYWNWLSQKTTPPLTEHIFLAGRSENKTSLSNSLLQEPAIIHIQAESILDLLGFTIATIHKIDDDNKREAIKNRLIILADETKLDKLPSNKNLIICLKKIIDDDNLSNSYLEKGHVIVPIINNNNLIINNNNLTNILKLNRAHPSDFHQAIQTMGTPEGEAQRWAQYYANSPTKLIRHLSSVSGYKETPSWKNNIKLLPIILLNSWYPHNDDNPNYQLVGGNFGALPMLRMLPRNDTEIISKKYETTYDDIETTLLSISTDADNPFIRGKHNHWQLDAPFDTIEYALPYISSAGLKQFKQIAIAVFSDHQPIKLDSGDHHYTYQYSDYLRSGIAETLAIIANMNIVLNNSQQAQKFVDDIVTLIFADDGFAHILARSDTIHAWDRKDIISLLAEASPDNFLHAVNSLSQKDVNQILDNQDRRARLLWALEILAWLPEYFEKAILTLVKLANLSPDIAGNSSLASLKNILCLWLPETEVSFDEIMNILKRIMHENRSVGWKLLYELSEKPYAKYPAQQPLYRVTNNTERVTSILVTELNTKSQAILSLMIEYAENDLHAWQHIFNRLRDLNEASVKIILPAIESHTTILSQATNRDELWEVLNSIINHHKTFGQGRWAFPDETLDRIQNIADNLSPDIIKKHAWLFSNYPMIGNFDDHVLHEAEARKRQGQALEEIIKSHGISAIKKLLKNVQDEFFVGRALVNLSDATQQIDTVIKLFSVENELDGEVKNFFSAISQCSSHNHKEKWLAFVKEYTKRPTYHKQILTAFLHTYPAHSDRGFWNFVASLGADIENSYWQKVPFQTALGALDQIHDDALLLEGIKRYLNFDRGNDVIQLCGLYENALARLSEQKIIEILKHPSIYNPSAHHHNSHVMFSHYIQKIFKHVAERDDISFDTLCDLEWRFSEALLAFNSNYKNFALYKKFIAVPEFFMQEIICVLDKNNKRKAMTLYDGFVKYNAINCSHDELTRWIVEMQKLAQQCDKQDIVDIIIGELLATFPIIDDDGTMPEPQLLLILNQYAENEKIKDVFISRKFNNIGVISGDGKETFEPLIENTEKAIDIFSKKGTYSKAVDILKIVLQRYEEYYERNKTDMLDIMG